MTHLGERISDLVDGQLPAEAAERAYAHLASCYGCRDQVEAERLMKARLAALALPSPRDDLVQRLLAMGGPAGPVPPRQGHVPGTARPRTVPVEVVSLPLEPAEPGLLQVAAFGPVQRESVPRESARRESDLAAAELGGLRAGPLQSAVGVVGPEGRRPSGSRRPSRLSAAAAAAVRPSTIRSTARSAGTSVRLAAGPGATSARRGRRTRLTVAVLGALGAVGAGVGVLTAGGASAAGTVVPTTTELSVIGSAVNVTRLPVLLDIPTGWQLTRRISDRTSQAGGGSGR